MAEKTLKALADALRESDAYWAERVKIEFAEELGRLMERRAVTRAQFAERIGSSAAYVTKALRGDTNFTIESMVKLVRALDGSLDVRVTMDDGRRSRPPRSSGGSYLRKLPSDQDKVADGD